MENTRCAHRHGGIRRVHDYFFPHACNGYRPHFFSALSLGLIAGGLIALNALYFVDTKLVLQKTDFLAAVLPGVLTNLTNDDRQDNSLSPVVHDPKLAQVAQTVANDMAAKGYFSHNSPEGRTPWTWLNQAGYRYAYAGQNLAVNFTDSQEVEDAWLKSPTHRANIMKREYTHIGIAVANGTYKGKDATFVVQYFATPAAPAAAPAKPVVAPRGVEPATAAPEPAPAEQNPSPAPVAVVVETPEPVASSTEVLGESFLPEQPTIVAAASEPLTLFATAVTSPYRTLLIVLTLAMAAVIVLLGIAVGTHLRHQYIEVIGGGLVLLAIITAGIVMATLQHDPVEVPTEGSSSIETAVAG